MKRIIYIFIIWALISCQNEKENFTYLSLSESLNLASPETLIAFKDKYPVGIKIKDSLAYIIQIKSDTCIMVLDINAKKIVNSVGRTGYGPNDLLNPNFAITIENDVPEVILEEGNLKKIVSIEKETIDNQFKLKEYIEYPDNLFISSEINFSKNYIAGRKVGMKEGKMFYIYNRNDGSIIEMDHYPRIEIPTVDPNYTFAACIALNEKKNRIIAGMFFFDLFHLYDLTGKRLNTFCFSEDCIPKTDKKNKILDVQNGYSGIVRVFTTSDYCYLLRITKSPIREYESSMLIQLDWDGKLIKSYYISNNISGQFYIDESKQKFYTIQDFIDSEGEEIFEVVSYKLDT